MPELFIITGSNGAGKSTVGPDYLPEEIRRSYQVFDGDKLFMQKQKELWLSGLRVYKEARKIAYDYFSDTFDMLVTEAMENKKALYMKGILQTTPHGIFPEILKLPDINCI